METLELIRRIRAGQDVRDSQEALYSRVRLVLLDRLGNRISGRVRARLDSEDVLHEAFIRAMGALDLFDPRSEEAFFAWIYTIARNLILDQSKRRSVGAVHFAAGEDEHGPRASRVEAHIRRPESLLLRREQIESLLGRLKPREAEIIRLHRLEGLSFAEIAQRWGKTPGAVQRAFSRAWRNLCVIAGTGQV